MDNRENTLIGATNDENGQINVVKDYLPNEDDASIPEMAKRFKARDQPWMIVTDVCRFLPSSLHFILHHSSSRSTVDDEKRRDR